MRPRHAEVSKRRTKLADERVDRRLYRRRRSRPSDGVDQLGGVSENDLKGKSAEFATPSVLLRLAKEHDRMFTY
jgi:hypothetical protein